MFLSPHDNDQGDSLSFMNLYLANALVRVVSENFSQYSISMQRSLLEGIFQLADECKENLSERPDALEYDHFQISLTLIKLFASEALKNGNLSEGFQLVAECAGPMAAFPQDAV